MFFKLFLIFTLVPVVELALLIKVGTLIGTLNTVVLVIGTALAGAFLVRLEGINVIYRFQRNLAEGIFPAEEILNLAEGIFPAEEIFDGALLLVAGAVLITPGFLTDILGLLIVLAPSREVFKGLIRRYVEKNFFVV
jgi:UPF0716 protein FxsA